MSSTAEALTDLQVADLIGISRRKVHDLAATDKSFPASIRIGRSRRWIREEVIDWLRRKAPRDEPPRRRTAPLSPK